jgi:hypothetical protein
MKCPRAQQSDQGASKVKVSHNNMVSGVERCSGRRRFGG